MRDQQEAASLRRLQADELCDFQAAQLDGAAQEDASPDNLRSRAPVAISAELRATKTRIETSKKEAITAAEQHAQVLREELVHHPDVYRGRQSSSQREYPESGVGRRRSRG
ncbi:hypothetical protein PC116_g4723 [Phytophthora cactorum]|uniref:Uncharacterized protein n=1 Tax=Phytophthora cactorum TaxID=29920 RepID=A0A329RNU8_9STRA|nr:hypothetical protein Pcac1_g17758 [Phytophthora cactorum]KAG2930197.1 hypothetical protein PC115_g6601 [Phytophthora cactorum]KAG2946219.1 hypothetical protein PC117_g7829 [Phytophthora cactorum]KAG2994233.1 hypothetical protein PC120_g22053 [Phytophthora cactorum]KAG3154674.1 hypothetical protein PC128_g22267 [Phytophthora cactorum]